jgi:hypothetical protein
MSALYLGSKDAVVLTGVLSVGCVVTVHTWPTLCCQLRKNWPKTSVSLLKFISRLSVEREPMETASNGDRRRKKKKQICKRITNNEMAKQLLPEIKVEMFNKINVTHKGKNKERNLLHGLPISQCL